MNDVYIVSIGSELTKGEIANTNAAYISRELSRRGLDVRSILTCPDDFENAVQSIENLLKNNGIFIITGGLGGTKDDITRRIVAGALRKELLLDEEKAHDLEEFYKKRSREFIDHDRMQASFPAGGILLENTVGLAYGFYIHDKGRYIFSLPGVPREMKVMFDSQVMEMIAKEGLLNHEYAYEIVRFSDISEYTLDRRIDSILREFTGIEYGTRASYGIIKVRIETSRGNLETAVQALIRELQPYYINRGREELGHTVGELLKRHNHTLSVAESCTGGLLSKTITDIPGSSEYYRGGIVAYSNDLKTRLLNVSSVTLSEYGAVSRQTAAQMAEGAAEYLGSDFSLSTTGVAGPGGGTKQEPAGTVFIGFASKDEKTRVVEFHFRGDRETVRMMSVNKALFILYRYIGRMQKG